MSPDLLTALQTLAQLPDRPFGCEEFITWEEGALDALLRDGVLVTAPTAATVWCGGCDEREAVPWDDDPGDPQQIRYTCTTYGTEHQAPRAWTCRYRVDMTALALRIGAGLGSQQEPEISEQQRIHRWERLPILGVTRTVVIARGLGWKDGTALWEKLGLTPTAILIAVGPKPRVPTHLRLDERGTLHLSLWSILDVDDEARITVDRERLEEEVAAQLEQRAPKATPTKRDVAKQVKLRLIERELRARLVVARKQLLDGNGGAAEATCRATTGYDELGKMAGIDKSTVSRHLRSGMPEAEAVQVLLAVARDLQALREWNPG